MWSSRWPWYARAVDRRESYCGSADAEVFDRIDSVNWQNLDGEGTRPDGPPHSGERGRFDGALEEVLHLVTSGWQVATPEARGYGPGSRLTDAMDLARGGRLSQVPHEIRCRSGCDTVSVPTALRPARCRA